MGFSSSIDYFVNPKDKLVAETKRKGHFFIISFFIFFIFALIGEVYAIAADFGGVEAIIGNGILCIVIFSSFFIYRKWGLRILLVNIITAMGYMSNQGTYEYSGGIYSSDLVNGIVICAWIFLVANRTTGLIWFSITFLTITFYYIAEINGFKDFKTDAFKNPAYYHYINYGFCCLFLAIIINMYENNKNKYLKELKSSQLDLQAKGRELEVKNKDVTDSINYAKRIQYAVLPQEETIYRSVPLSFIFYKPKDIVSGDFFWFHEINKDEYILVCADCTGHGVPGAFMTVIGSSLLNQTVIDNKIYKPSDILLELDKQINFTLKQQKDNDISVQDGMDLTLIKVNKTKKEVVITSAKRPVVFIRNKELQEIKGSKFSLGGMRTDVKTFKEDVINYQEDDVLYLFTDGYGDQFGGEKAKKFSSKRIRELFLDVHRLPMQEQKTKVAKTIASWQGDLEQIDDMLVIGIKL